mgnify:CR=1 FL=1
MTHSQISHIESGETKNPNISIVIDAARFFHVSTDYLLGITQITTPKSYDISELGLSEEPVKRLITGRIDINILNCLLEHEHISTTVYYDSQFLRWYHYRGSHGSKPGGIDFADRSVDRI